MRLTSAILAHWKEAASVMVYAQTPKVRSAMLAADGSTFSPYVDKVHGRKEYNPDYQILMLERNSKSKFMPSAYVYPGGRVSDSDHDSNWLQLFSSADVNSLEGSLPEVSQNADERSPMLLPRQDWAVDPNIALRICSIRETFEEAGILICAKTSDVKNKGESNLRHGDLSNFSLDHMDPVDLKAWRTLVQKEPSKFVDFCKELDVVPNVWSLWEWDNWLTPTNMSELHNNRRYDTMFYVCGLPHMPTVGHDEQEIVDHKWCWADRALAQHAAGELWLAPPQVYALSRLLHGAASYAALTRHAAHRAALGSRRWLPVRMNADDGTVAVLPGDDLYPQGDDLDIYGERPAPALEGSMTDLLTSSKDVHRFEFWSLHDTRLQTNYTDPCGHINL